MCAPFISASPIRNRKIGIIATEATIASGAYARALKSLQPNLEIYTRACPLFVPLAEEGWVDNEIGTAFDKEQQLMKDREGAKVQVLVPLNLDGYLFSDKWKSGYQTQVKRRLAADFTEASDAAKFDAQVERLIRALRADEGAREKPPRARL